MNAPKEPGNIEIIENPKLLTIPRVIGEWGFTTIMWGFWVYLLLPLLGLGLWVLGIHFFYQEVILEAGYLELLALIRTLGLVVLIVFSFLRMWGLYNYWAFGKKNRRTQVGKASVESLSETFQISVQEVVKLQNSKEVIWPLERRNE